MLDMQQQPSLSPISPSTVPTARNGVPEVSRNPYRPLPGLFPSQSNYDNGPSPENGVFMNLSNDNNSPSQPPGGLGRSQGAM